MFKKVLAAIAVLGVFYSAMGQNIEGVNARLDGMAGNGVVSDIGWTIGKPSALYAFPDQVQASALIIDIEGMGTTFGSIIAIKSIGEHFLIGVTMNGRRAMSGNFYTKAITFGTFIENFSSANLGQNFPIYPELNFCIRPNENLSIGLGGYFEHSKFNDDKMKNTVYNYENTSGQTVENIMNYDSTVFRKYSGIGIIADARIWFGGFKINPEIKIFMPKLDGKIETDQNDKFNKDHNVTESMNVVSLDDHTVTTDLKNNLFLRVGSKFSNTINETFWILGLWYKTERFEMERTVDINGTILDYNTTDSAYSSSSTATTWAHNKTSYDWWLGCQPSFSDNLVICPEYSGFVRVTTKTPPPGANQDTTAIKLKHKFRLGAEMSVKGFWVFEEFFPRMGFNYYLTRDLQDNVNADSSSENVNNPYSSNCDSDFDDDGRGAKVTVGFGLKGKRGTFDLSLDVLQWKTTGLSGPGAAIASFTLDFARKEE